MRMTTCEHTQPVPPSPMELAAMEEKKKKEEADKEAARLLEDKPAAHERPASAMPGQTAMAMALPCHTLPARLPSRFDPGGVMVLGLCV